MQRRPEFKSFAWFVAAFFGTPILFGLLSSLIYFVGYRFLGVELQAEPKWLENTAFVINAAAGVVCVFLMTRAITNKTYTIIVLVLPVFVYAWIKCISVQDEFVAYFGYSCCSDQAATVSSILNIALNPFAPFWTMVRYN